ncbi:MAG: hypothetical protein RL322_3201, partial [Pseudomonadota bacterium]
RGVRKLGPPGLRQCARLIRRRPLLVGSRDSLAGRTRSALGRMLGAA